jgi:hypothetical protein
MTLSKRAALLAPICMSLEVESAIIEARDAYFPRNS